MRRALISVGAVLLASVVLGSTVFRAQAAHAAGSILGVFVTNDSSHAVPVRDQNTDVNGNIRVHEQGTANVHEQGTANVNVTNSSLPVAPATPITGGGKDVRVGEDTPAIYSSPQTASALSISLSSDVSSVIFSYQGVQVAAFLGPAENGNSSINLALTRPIEFNTINCITPSTGVCAVSWVGAEP
ncbi:MAG TPA: hypothetical protein VIV12_03170 [Streptosporangiaceae bacterium]